VSRFALAHVATDNDITGHNNQNIAQQSLAGIGFDVSCKDQARNSKAAQLCQKLSDVLGYYTEIHTVSQFISLLATTLTAQIEHSVVCVCVCLCLHTRTLKRNDICKIFGTLVQLSPI